MDESFARSKKVTVQLTVAENFLGTPAAGQAIDRAAQILRSGGTVAFPTETVYGLGANALSVEAVTGIFIAKRRPSWDPLIVHISDFAMLQVVVTSISPTAQKLIDAFWPGPLTLLLPKSAAVPGEVTAGRQLVGVRIPAHPIAQALIAAANVPVAAPSANRFGHTSPTTAQHVLDDLDGRIDMVIDGGPTSRGLESTVVGIEENLITLYRPGTISIEQIEAVTGTVRIYQPPENQTGSSPESLPSPGVGIRHYAPRASVVVADVGGGSEYEQQGKWMLILQELSATSDRVGVMLPTGWPVPPEFSGAQYDWGDWQNDQELAQRLFAGLRALDDKGVDRILCPLPNPKGLGAAMQDRILKAAQLSK